MKKRILISLILATLLVACDNLQITTPSGSVSTSGIYATISGIDDGSSTTIITQLRTVSNSPYPDITLDSSDSLYASSVGTTTDINQGGSSFGGTAQISNGLKQLEQRNMVINDFLQSTYPAPEYSTVYPQTNAAGTTYYLNFERTNYNSIENIPIVIASPFQLSTSQSGQVARTDNLTATWIPSSDSTETMWYQTIYICQDTAGTSGADPTTVTKLTGAPGTINIPQPSAISSINAPCAVTLVLYRQKPTTPSSSINSGFGLGAVITGVQRRYITFYSNP